MGVDVKGRCKLFSALRIIIVGNHCTNYCPDQNRCVIWVCRWSKASWSVLCASVLFVAKIPTFRCLSVLFHSRVEVISLKFRLNAHGFTEIKLSHKSSFFARHLFNLFYKIFFKLKTTEVSLGHKFSFCQCGLRLLSNQGTMLYTGTCTSATASMCIFVEKNVVQTISFGLRPNH